MSDPARRALEDALDFAALRSRRDRIVAQVVAAAERGLLIVGSAALPRKVAHAVQAAGGKVAAFVEYDARFWGGEADGIPVLPLDQAIALAGPGALALVGIWSPNHVYRETEAWLKAKGVDAVLPVNAAFWAYGEALGEHYQLGGPELYAEGAESILSTYDALDDEDSRRQYAGIVGYRLTLESDRIPLPRTRRHYFDPAISHIGDDAVVADLGAFSGDTLDTFLFWQGSRFGRFVGFEPDRTSFQRLRDYCERLPKAVSDRVECVYAGVGSEPGVLRFSTSGALGSRPTAEGEIEVPRITIDDHFEGRPLDYLKMDIEGAERAALAGATRTIDRCRPTLGISVYHAPDDIFRIPTEMIECLDGHSFRFRVHDFDGIDAVFYAVPDERAPVAH